MRKINFKKTFCIVISLIMICAMLSACNSKEDKNKDKPHPIATITVKDYGVITVELYQDVAQAK